MTPHRHAALLAALALLAASAAPARGDDAGGAGKKKIRVVIIDGQNNHDWRSTTPLLKKELEDTGRFAVDVSSNLKPGDNPGRVESVSFPPDLSRYDVLMSLT
jgi:hypothetical protein